jgi:O-antigen/teichoic acid export membrane protein
MCGTALTDLFRSHLFEAESRRDAKQASRIFRAWICAQSGAGVLAFVVFVVAGPWISTLLLGEAYRVDAVPIMAWAALGYGTYGVNQVLENRMLSLGTSRVLLISTAIGAASNVGAAFVLVRANGIIGAAQATFCSSALQTIVTAVLVRRELHRRTLSVQEAG